jgi:hypothetical protein
VSITNTGSATTTLGAVALSNTADFDVTTSGSPLDAVTGSRTVTVKLKTGKLNGGSPYSTTVNPTIGGTLHGATTSGSVTVNRALEITAYSPSNRNITMLTNEAAKTATFTVKNNSDSAAAISGVTVASGTGWSVDGSTIPTSIGPGESKTIPVNAPARTDPGSSTATFTVDATDFTDVTTDPITVTASWGPTTVEVTPASLSWSGQVGAPTSATFTITNTGNDFPVTLSVPGSVAATAQANGPVDGSPGSFTVTANSGTQTLQPQASVTVTVKADNLMDEAGNAYKANLTVTKTSSNTVTGLPGTVELTYSNGRPET